MNLKQYMTKTNIGYRELAKKAGVHHTTIFSFLNGRTKTFRPEIAEKISKEGTEKGFHVLDAPVTGGDTGAKNATLSILVGGEKEDFDACMELFKAMGTNINYQGKAGCGQHAKLANQIMIAGALSGVCEAFSYAQAKGLDLNVLFDSVSTGAAGSKQLDAFGPKIIAGDYAPGFFMKHFIKDMKLALTEANMSGLSLEVLSLVLSNYEEHPYGTGARMGLAWLTGGFHHQLPVCPLLSDGILYLSVYVSSTETCRT